MLCSSQLLCTRLRTGEVAVQQAAERPAGAQLVRQALDLAALLRRQMHHLALRCTALGLSC